MKTMTYFGLLLTLLLAGCNTYIPPGAKADLQAFAPASIQEGFAAKATSPFPASIATVRVQAPGYTNHYLKQRPGTYGTGRYSIVTAREVEEQSHVDRIAKLPQIAGIVTVNRLLLPTALESDKEIREAAARLQADLLFIYTFDTSFFDNDLAKPLTAISLGFAPTHKIALSTTASGLLMDTRTGYIYSVYEATTKAGTVASMWGSEDAADLARQGSEKEAFGKLVDEFVSNWPKILQRYLKKD